MNEDQKCKLICEIPYKTNIGETRRTFSVCKKEEGCEKETAGACTCPTKRPTTAKAAISDGCKRENHMNWDKAWRLGHKLTGR